MQFLYQIQENDNGKTIRNYLKELGYSTRLISQIKLVDNGFLLNKHPVHTNATLSFGDSLAITLPKEKPSEKIIPKELPIHIIYEDRDIIVIDKTADMPIHISINNMDNTLANALAYYYKQKEQPFVFRCINRIDRDTTGLVLLAKHALSGCILSAQVKQHKIRREYLAIVEGYIDNPGTINAPIGRDPNSILSREIDWKSGDTAITHYSPLLSRTDFSLLRIRLETGRTHQIRVHMKSIGHPLPGDYLYNPVYTTIKRQPLHSWKLSFSHPITHQEMTFTTKLPADMMAIFRS